MNKCLVGAFGLMVFGWISPVYAYDDCNGTDDWAMYNYDVSGTRHNTREDKLTPWNVGGLHQIWNVPTPAPVTGTPIVVDDKAYVGDWLGNFYKLDARNGHIAWTAHVDGPVSGTALLYQTRLIFGDQLGFIYGLDPTSGAIKWKVRPNPHSEAAIFGAATPIGGNVAIGIASNEEIAALDPSYNCCSFRGSVVLLDPSNGHVLWQTYVISETERAAGASGAGVWSTPTYDQDLDLIYFSTGNNYTDPTNDKSDAVIALDAYTGAIRWSNQRVKNDSSTFRDPVEVNSDSDFGDSVQIYRLPSGRKVVGAGNKNGIYSVFDAATGELVREKQLQVGGSLGGLFADSATAYGITYANGSDWPDPFNFDVLPNAGLLTAVTGDAQHVVWQLSIPQKANLSGVAVANGVVYFASLNPGTGDRLSNSSGTLFAVNASTGAQLAAVPLGNCANSGPAISNGRVLFGLGNELLFSGQPTGNIVALGL
jgi:polyvinyl alcohol dehydrogenase (cytochrome)